MQTILCGTPDLSAAFEPGRFSSAFVFGVSFVEADARFVADTSGGNANVVPEARRRNCRRWEEFVAFMTIILARETPSHSSHLPPTR